MITPRRTSCQGEMSEVNAVGGVQILTASIQQRAKQLLNCGNFDVMDSCWDVHSPSIPIPLQFTTSCTNHRGDRWSKCRKTCRGRQQIWNTLCFQKNSRYGAIQNAIRQNVPSEEGVEFPSSWFSITCARKRDRCNSSGVMFTLIMLARSPRVTKFRRSASKWARTPAPEKSAQI